MKKQISILIIVLTMLVSVLPTNLVFAETSDNKVFSYTVNETTGITVKGTESIEGSIYVIAGSYLNNKMVAMDMVELTARNEETLSLQDWGQKVRLFAVTKDHMPICSAKIVWADGEVILNTAELESRIKEANNLLNGDYLISKDGSDVTVDEQWITAEMRNNLQHALDSAQEWFYNNEFETQEDVDAAVTALKDAIHAFQPAFGTATSALNTSELESIMETAEDLLNMCYKISVDGSDVAADEQWVTLEMNDNLQYALDAAREWFYNDEFETQDDVDAATAALKDAISAFKPAYGIPADILDTSELESKLNEAEYLMNWGYHISTDGSDVPQDQKWVTAEMMENLTDAFAAAAEWFYNNEFETQAQIDDAIASIEEAIAAFQPADGLL